MSISPTKTTVKSAKEQYREINPAWSAPGSRKFRDRLALAAAAAIPAAGQVRMYHFALLKSIFAVPDTPCILGTVVARGGGRRAVFGYAVWFAPTDPSAQAPELVVCGPAPVSRDGEFRDRVLPFELLGKILATAEAGIAAQRRVDAAIADGRIQIAIEFGGQPSTAPQMADLARNIFVAATWLTCMVQIPREINYDPNAIEIIKQFNDMTNTRATFLQPVELFISALPACGFKLEPMSIADAAAVRDTDPAIQRGTWREISAAEMVTELVINFIAPCFPIFVDWCAVADVDADTFSNKEITDKFVDSAIAEHALGEVMSARTSVEGGNLPILSSALYDAAMTSNAVIQSGAGCGQFVEHVGFTIGYWAQYIPPPGADDLMSKLSDQNLCGESVLFELLYSLTALHEHSRVAHCDLHMHNITIASITKTNKTANPKQDLVKVYIVGERGEADAYVVAQQLVQLFAIDFSRAQYMPDREATAGLPAADRARRERGAARRAARALALYLPGAPPNDLVAAAIARPRAAWRALAAADLLAASRAVAAAVAAAGTRGYVIHRVARAAAAAERAAAHALVSAATRLGFRPTTAPADSGLADAICRAGPAPGAASPDIAGYAVGGQPDDPIAQCAARLVLGGDVRAEAGPDFANQPAGVHGGGPAVADLDSDPDLELDSDAEFAARPTVASVVWMPPVEPADNAPGPGRAVLRAAFGEASWAKAAARAERAGRELVVADVWSLENPRQYSGRDRARFPPWADMPLVAELRRTHGETPVARAAMSIDELAFSHTTMDRAAEAVIAKFPGVREPLPVDADVF